MPETSRLKVKRGDTAPAFRAQCFGGEPSVPVDLTGATAKLVTRRGSTVRRLELVVEPGTTGWVHHDWVTDDLAMAGVLRAEVEVTFADGRVQTFPADGHVAIEIVDDLG